MNVELIKQILKGKTATLEYVHDGALHYCITYPAFDRGSVIRKDFRFTVSFEEVAGGRFEPIEKAAHMMRWIRKQIEENENGKRTNSTDQRSGSTGQDQEPEEEDH